MKNNIVTRFPPSPTGLLHIGNVRTGLYNYFFALQNEGKFIFRIEDTDKERSKKEYEEDIFKSMEWLGLKYDGVTRQSERAGIHKKYLEKLLAEGKAYISKEEPKEEGQRTEVIRFKNPNTNITFTDLIRGEVSIDTTDLKDFVIAKSLDEPLYHLAVVVDDFEMGITHVIRGEDHISNTPRQILLLEAIGGSRPVYAHLPLIFAEDRSKLSKRKHGERVSLKHYIEQGYLPEAIINYMSLLGWNPGTDQEIFTFEELIKAFDISKVQKGGAIFNEEKLKWFNKEHMKRLPAEVLEQKMKEIITSVYKVSDNDIKHFTPVILERISTFGEARALIQQGEFDYLFKSPDYSIELLYWKGQKDHEALIRRLNEVIKILGRIDEKDYKQAIIKDALWEYATSEGRGEVLWPTRVALSGKEKSPDPFVLAELLGKEESLKRLHSALEKVSHA
ncbi:glutamate--tRNA ligase [Candidatus Parcubacteria bacterium]|nr:glutamate--tRNA ligase [Candidatus Parcubacteria bacterium]